MTAPTKPFIQKRHTEGRRGYWTATDGMLTVPASTFEEALDWATRRANNICQFEECGARAMVGSKYSMCPTHHDNAVETFRQADKARREDTPDATNQRNPVWWKTVKRHQLIPVEDMWDVRRLVARLSDEEVAGLSKFPPRLPAKARAVDLGLLSRQGGPVYLTPKVCAYLRGEYDVVGSAAA